MAVAQASVAIESSRPAIRLAGAAAGDLTAGLVTARVREDVHGLSDCELEVGNWGAIEGGRVGHLYFDRRALEFGRQLEVGVPGGTLFDGRISAIEARFPEGGPPTIVVLAEDRLQDLRMTRRTRTFEDVSDADIVARIAGDHGLTADVAVSGPTHRLLAQVDQSDLAFLRERARALDAELRVTGSVLEVKPRAAGSPALTLTYGKELRELRVIADLADQRTSVTVSGWDVAAKRAIEETADDGVLGGELGGAESGPSILRTAFGARADGRANADPHTAEEARVRAESLLKRQARRFLTGHGTAEARAGMRAGATIRIAGLGPLFEGDYYVTAVTHRFDGVLGLRSELCVERPGLGRAS